MRALTNRKYPPLAIGDNVNILKKSKPNEKERVSRGSIELFKVKSINKILGQEHYKVEGADRDYIRGEILKVCYGCAAQSAFKKGVLRAWGNKVHVNC